MKVLVIGSAKSGNAAAKLLNKLGYEVIITDQNEIKEKEELESLGIQVVDKGHPDWLKNTDYAFVVKNPGIKYTVEFIDYFVRNNIKIYTEIEIAYNYSKNFKYGAITGTNGKTTITSMLYECLKMNGKAIVAGNIGTPLSVWAYELGDEEKDVALELSNFQLLGVEKFRPTVSVVCNLAPDHLDYMPTVESYYESKMNIAMNQKDDDWFLRNVDDELVMHYSKDVKCEVIDFSLKRTDVDVYLKDGEVFFRNEHLFYVKDLKVVGNHNVSNAMIACVMAMKLGVSREDVEKAITSFKGIEHRIEYIGEKDGIKFYNDSKATNTQAACIGLSSFEKNIILLAGGKDKGISFEEMHDYDERVKHCFTFGQTKEKIAHEFTRSTQCETMIDALHEAMKIAKSGDVILLSPACSSYDQFKSYEQRGDIFREECLNIIQ